MGTRETIYGRWWNRRGHDHEGCMSGALRRCQCGLVAFAGTHNQQEVGDHIVALWLATLHELTLSADYCIRLPTLGGSNYFGSTISIRK
jgi:hypothetical protein